MSPAFLFAISCLALVALGHVWTGSIGAGASVFGAALCVCVLPGYFVLDAFAGGRRRSLPERCVFSVGFSLFFVQCICIVALTLHVSLRAMGFVVLLLVAVAAMRRRWSRPEVPTEQVEDLDGTGLPPYALLVWIAAGLVAFGIGNLDSASQFENLIAIGISDALRGALRFQDAYYISGVAPVYPFPGLHYAYALVGDIANTTTMFAFEKMRFLWTVTALATVFVGVRALSGSAGFAYLALLGSSVLALAGPLGSVSGYYWGQLATTSNPNDVEMNVLAPIALSSLFMVLSPAGRGRRELLLLFACIALVLSAIHQRELFQILVYGASGFLMLAITRQYKPLFGLGLAMAIPVCGALAFQAWAGHHGPGVGNLLAEVRVRLLNDLNNIDLFTAFRPYASGVNAYDFSFSRGLNGFMLCLASIVLIRRRASTAVRAGGLAVAAFLFTASFAILAIPVIYVTYDELLNTPVRHVIYVLYCCSWISLGMFLRWIEARWSRKRVIALGVVTAALAAGASHLLARYITSSEPLVLATAVCGLLAAFMPSVRSLQIGEQIDRARRLGVSSVLPSIAAFALLTALPNDALFTNFAKGMAAWTPQAVLREEYRAYLRSRPGSREGECREQTATLFERTIDFATCAPPFAVVESLYAHLPQSSVLLFNPLGDFAPIGLIPVKLATPPNFLYRNWESAFPRIANVIGASVRTHGGMPFFSSRAKPEERFSDARALGATHVLVDPGFRSVALATALSRPDLFRVVMDKSHWVLLAVSQ